MFKSMVHLSLFDIVQFINIAEKPERCYWFLRAITKDEIKTRQKSVTQNYALTKLYTNSRLLFKLNTLLFSRQWQQNYKTQTR